MTAFEIHANAMATAQRLTGACPTFVWKGQAWQIIPNTTRQRNPLGVGGFGWDFELQFHALVRQFASAGYLTAQALAAAMLPNTALQYLGENFKIESVDILPGGLIVHIGANSINQGA